MKNEPPPERAREGNEVRQEKTANDSGRNRKGRSRKMPESEKWSRTHIANRLMVWTTALVAFATLFYAVATAFQVYLFHKNAAETARQTDKLIDASEKQSVVIREALEETKRANREAADRAERALSATEKQANASQTQASASEVSARAAEKAIDVAQLGTRAYISVDHMRLLNPLEANKPIVMLFEFVNDGNSPAEISGYGTYYIDRQLRDCTYSNQLAFNRIVVAPKSPRSQQIVISRTGIGQDAVDAITGCTEARKCEWYIQLCIKTTYSTVGGRFPFENCSYYFDGLNSFLECPKK